MNDEAESSEEIPAGRVPAAFHVTDLLVPGAYSHPVSTLGLVETALSWVLLTGDYAYKIRKPVRLGHVDFSTLALRHAACFEELRLNRRYAPEIYLDVVPITGIGEHPLVDGIGQAMEYAIKMHEFPQASRLDRLLADDLLSQKDIDTLASAVAAFHRDAPVALPTGPYGVPASIQHTEQEVLAALMADTDPQRSQRLREIERWTRARGKRLAALQKERRSAGLVRELHGDLRLENIVRLNDQMVPFDCIEFSTTLRWIDVINDLAFLSMDLHARGRSDLAYRMLNRYFEISGDHAGVPLLRYFEVYRALQRARLSGVGGDGANHALRSIPLQDAERYVQLAQRRSHPEGPAMILMHGLAGSGKTWLSERLMATLPAIRLRADVERARLRGARLESDFDEGPALMGGLYSDAESARNYDHLAQAATSVLQGGENVILDAAFLHRADRLRFSALARKLGMPFLIVGCRAPMAELARRIASRMLSALDASRADEAVLHHQIAHAEPLNEDELPAALFVETADPAQVSRLIANLRSELRSVKADRALLDA